MTTPDPRRGDEPTMDGDDDLQAGHLTDPDGGAAGDESSGDRPDAEDQAEVELDELEDDAAPGGQHGPTADYGEG